MPETNVIEENTNSDEDRTVYKKAVADLDKTVSEAGFVCGLPLPCFSKLVFQKSNLVFRF